MIKKYALIVGALLCAVTSGFGQYSIDFESAPLKNAYASGTITLNGIDWNMTEAMIRPPASPDLDWYNGTRSARIRGYGTSIMTMLEDKTNGIGTISFQYRRYGTDARVDWMVEYSTDGGLNWIQVGSSFTSPANNIVQIFNETIDVAGNARIRIKRATESGVLNRRLNIDDIVITDYVPCFDTVDWANVQSPNTSPQNIVHGNAFDVYVQAYEPGVTDASNTAPGVGLQAWVGYNTVDDDPENNDDWTWIPATYNVDVGNNDEFVADIGSAMAPGTYYYASRFQLDDCVYAYGGTGGLWNNDSVELIITPVQVDFCNVDFPKSGIIVAGNDHTVYAQAYEPGVTDAAGQGANILAWIGYNSIGINHQPWNATGWTWVPAAYDSDFGNNDQYVATFGSSLSPGTYYYASRFQLNGSSYSYGGIYEDNMGNFWDDDMYISGILTVTNPPLAEVVITEIMYNPAGFDDEWIEICNVSGSTQNLSGYIVRTDAPYDFTFPIGSFIADGDCITVSLGSNGDGTYNNPCPFTADYGIDAFTNDTDHLFNSAGGHLIQLLATDGVTVADSVTYYTSSGGNGNNATLHLSDIGLDNSDTSINWQQVLNGGSPGVNLLVSPCSPTIPEIDVERNTYASIPNGALPTTGHNTLWAVTNVGDSANKTFFVRNEGFADLTITSMTSSNTADFELVNLPPTFPFVLTPGGFIEFEIEFSPDTAVPNPKTSTITIINDDADENPYTFGVRGSAGCPLYTGTLSPASGPVGTEITITSNEGQNLNGATASLNGEPLTIISSSTDELVVQIPNTITTGGALTVLLSGGCSFTHGFILIDQAVSGCEGTGGANASDIFISQVTDSGDDSFTYIELYNGTGSTVNLNDYSIVLYNNGRSSPVNANYTIGLNNVNLPNGTTYVLAIGTNNMDCATEHNISGLADQQYGVAGVSINFGDGNDHTTGHDHLRLYNGATYIDAWGIYEDESWATSLNLGGKGANFMRKNDVTVPSTSFVISDWIVQDWGNTCDDLDYSDIGTFDFMSGIPPVVSILNPPLSGCDLTTTLTITASEGYGGGNPLVYLWYYSAPGDPGWTVVPDDATYDDVNTDTLQILNVVGLDGYQYYCEVREDDATCFVASNAIKLDVSTSIWDGANWTPSIPDINAIAIIDGNYDTSIGGQQVSFSACQLFVNSGYLLIIEEGDYVEVENNVTIDGEIIVRPTGSFKQNNNAGLVNGAVLSNPSLVKVEKETAPMNNWYEYTYWSSPVSGETVGSALSDANPNRRFWYDAQNFLDATQETNNDNSTAPGQDDIDDDANDWVLAPAGMTMVAGMGFAATHNSIGFTAPGNRYKYTFEGPFNNGIFNVPLYRNDAELNDNNWNLIGNPYPSAISADALLAANAVIDMNVPGGVINGAIFLWSQDTPPDGDTNGNENLNFAQSDYAIINGTGTAAGGDGLMPSRYIPSGQAFFVSMDNSASSTVVSGTIRTTNFVFNNAMRINTNNDQFFRSSEGSLPNRLWVDLTSDNGVFNQILVGYVTGATDGNDGMYYDAPKNLSTNANTMLYSLLDDGSNIRLGIQGRNPNSLHSNEVIPLGFYTSIGEATIYTLSLSNTEGDFLASNNVYLVDRLLNIVHDLSGSNYSFTSHVGEFNDRFEIVFRSDALSVHEHEITADGLSIIELPNGQVRFSVASNLDILTVEIIDVLGRTLYNLKGNSPIETYSLDNLAQATYIAKVSLSNGQVITKRAVKRK